LSSSSGLAEKDKVFIHKKQWIFLIYFKLVIMLYIILYISSLFLRAFLFF
jgi:DNA phosphorothioation-dependent restriction protein DptG